MFSSLIKGLDEQGGGVRAYDLCARAARARVAAEPQNAAALLLIAFTAQRFVDTYDDQPVTGEIAAAELAQFRDFVALLERGEADGSAAARLAALNTAAARYLAGNRG